MQQRHDGELIVEIHEMADGPAGAVSRAGGPAFPFEGWLGLAAAVERALSAEPEATADRDD